MTRNPQLARIHIAKKELRMDDDAYRDMLERVTGQRSSKGLSYAAREKVLAECKRLGWEGHKTGRKRSEKAYVRKVFAVWGELKRKGIWKDPSVQSLCSFVKRMTGCDDPEWLTYHQASKVIEGLKKMKENG